MDRLEDNTNLLWDTATKQLVVIDHDVALEDGFWPTIFLGQHVFRADWSTILADNNRRAEYLTKMSVALKVWQGACDSAPDTWSNNFGSSSENLFDRAAGLEILNRCATEDLWKTN